MPAKSSRAREYAFLFVHFHYKFASLFSLRLNQAMFVRSAYLPPEMARQELGEKVDDELQGRDPVKASVQFEMWCFGALLYQVTLTPTMR